LRRLITISVLALGMLFSHTGVHTPKVVTTSKELPKVVLKAVKKAVKPFWFVPSSVMKMWAKVNICEMGGIWTGHGPVYSGGLGIRNVNWVAFGGLEFAPNAGDATPMQQVYVAMKIEQDSYVPDQYGCGQGW
jgi:hypothetical protein